jgi:cytochrome c-type biogenesis protein
MGQPVSVLVAFSAGLFSFLSPCVLPLFPSYLSFVTGMSVSDLTADLTAAARRRVMLHSLAFIGGFSIVFVALGASFSAASQFLLDYRAWIQVAGGVLIVIFGVFIAGVLAWVNRDRLPGVLAVLVVAGAGFTWLGGPQVILLFAGLVLAVLFRQAFSRTQQWQLREKPAGYVGSLAVGVTFAIGWTPCVGPILGAILTLASTADNVGRGMALLVAYSAGLGVPFLLSSVALGAFLKFFRRYRPFIPVVERAAGVLLILVGLLVFTNYYLVLNAWAVSLTPEWLLKRL